jgi:hypothetical protein
MKTTLARAFTGIFLLLLTFGFIFAQQQQETYKEKLINFDKKLAEYQLELDKMQKKLDSLNVTDKSRTTKEVVIEESVSDSGKQRKTIVLEDNSPGSEMRIEIYDALEMTKEEEKELLNRLQSLKGLESLSSLSGLRSLENLGHLKLPENLNKVEVIEKEIIAFEKKMNNQLNDITDLFAEIEMEKVLDADELLPDTTVIRLGTSKIVIIEDEKEKNNSFQWKSENGNDDKKFENIEYSSIGLSLGLNSFLYKYETNLPLKYNDLELDALRSWNINLKLVEAKVNLIQHRINLLTGIGIDWNNYRFRNNTLLSPKTDTLMITQDTIDFKKNKLMTQNLMGHLMLQFETKPGKNERTFDIGAGVFAGYLLNARTKQVSDERGKVKFEDDFQLNTFRYGICSRIGYGAFDFYLNYTLNDIFRTDLGPAVQNLSFGINFTGL